MKHRRLLLSIFVSVLVLFSFQFCDRELNGIRNKQMDLWGHFNDQGQLRMNGIYIAESCYWNNKDFSSANSLYILYENGQVFVLNNCAPEDIDPDSFVINFDHEEHDNKYEWGCFDISKEGVIQIQYPTRLMTPTLMEMPIFEELGDVLNDTSFVVHKLKVNNRFDKFEKIERRVYRLHRTLSKPDSVIALYDIFGAP